MKKIAVYGILILVVFTLGGYLGVKLTLKYLKSATNVERVTNRVYQAYSYAIKIDKNSNPESNQRIFNDLYLGLLRVNILLLEESQLIKEWACPKLKELYLNKDGIVSFARISGNEDKVAKLSENLNLLSKCQS